MEHHTVGGFRTFKKKKEKRCFGLFMISWLICFVDLITTMRVSQAIRNHQSVRKFGEKESQKSCEASSSQWRSGARKGWMKSASQSWTWVSVDYPASGLTSWQGVSYVLPDVLHQEVASGKVSVGNTSVPLELVQDWRHVFHIKWLLNVNLDKAYLLDPSCKRVISASLSVSSWQPITLLQNLFCRLQKIGLFHAISMSKSPSVNTHK